MARSRYRTVPNTRQPVILETRSLHEAAPEPAAPEIDLGSLRKDDLVNLAAASGVETDGTKADLVARLESAE